MAKNKFKYRCDECGWTGFYHMQEFGRSSRPRCGGCGSTWLERCTKEADERIALHSEEAHEQYKRNLVKQGFKESPDA